MFRLLQVPGSEGRAGMAALVEPEGGLDVAGFLKAVKKQLPPYAIPMFLRVVKHVDITGVYYCCA